jgi:hypothetical protein
MGPLLYLAVIALLVMSVGRLFRSRRTPIVIVSARDVNVRGWRTSSTMAWRDIRQIDVARAPVIGVDDFRVILFGRGAESLTVSDRCDGFKAFEARIFELWPQIRSEWERVFAGSPDISERVTAWKRS